MISKLYQLIRILDERTPWFDGAKHAIPGAQHARQFLDHLAIRDRQYKKREALSRMHEAVLTTPPLHCNPAAQVEVHTLTGQHHLCMYLTAVKSLLRFHHDIAVVVHDDGSLDETDQATLRHHVLGVRVIGRAKADEQMSRALANFPYSRKLRESIVNSLELFDNIALAQTDRVVNLNSDVLFFQEPSELLQWLKRDDQTIAGVYEERPAEQREFLTKYDCSVSPHVTTALSCFFKSIYDLEFIERILSGTWADWFTAQNLFPLLFDRQKRAHQVRFFDAERYQASGVFSENAVFRHYWTSTGRFADLQYRDSSHVITELGNPLV